MKKHKFTIYLRKQMQVPFNERISRLVLYENFVCIKTEKLFFNSIVFLKITFTMNTVFELG